LIPAGKRVLLDHLLLIVNVLTIEGTLIIDETTGSLNLVAETIIVNQGTLTIMNPTVATTPHTYGITILFKGVKTEGKTTKGIVCNSCNLEIYGNPPEFRWLPSAEATTTATIEVPTTTNSNPWTTSKTILIGPSGSNINAIDAKTITNIATATNVATITPDSALSGTRVRTAGTTNINYVVGAEVALQSRNIMMYGMDDGFGIKIEINGPMADLGKRVIIKDVEMRKCGQHSTPSSSCISFNNNGDLTGSTVEGVVMVNTYARMLTLNGGSSLTINNNVGYNVDGSGIVLETGAEMNNAITNNLVMRLKSNPKLGGIDLSPAGIYITNPNNKVTGNAVSGSDADGIVFSLRDTATGIGYNRNLCPSGMALLESQNNLVHTNARYGLRIENFAPRQIPCLASRNDSLADPFFNPVVRANFQGFIVALSPVGVYAENIG